MNDVLVLGLAVFSITYILRHTDGPLGVFKSLRILVGIVYHPIYDEDGEAVDIIESVPTNPFHIGALVGCFWCLGTWIAFLLNLVFQEFSIMVIFAAVGVAGFMYEVIE